MVQVCVAQQRVPAGRLQAEALLVVTPAAELHAAVMLAAKTLAVVRCFYQSAGQVPKRALL